MNFIRFVFYTVFFMFSPFIIAVSLATLSGDTGNNSPFAALPWLMFYTIPLGFIIMLVGIVYFIASWIRRD